MKNQIFKPKGLYGKYSIKKIVAVPNPGYDPMMGTKGQVENNELMLIEQQVSEGSEFFVLRLDKGQKDKNHRYACRKAVQAYADTIDPYLPELAEDIRNKWPVI